MMDDWRKMNIEPSIKIAILEKDLKETTEELELLKLKNAQLEKNINDTREHLRETINSQNQTIRYLQHYLSAYREKYPDFFYDIEPFDE